MAVEFKLPELGEGIESADVAELHVSEGDTIKAEQVVMELETDKAVVDLPCPHGGTVAKVHVAAGDSIKVGQTLLSIDEEGESGGDGKAESKPKKKAEPEQPDEETAKADEGEEETAEDEEPEEEPEEKPDAKEDKKAARAKDKEQSEESEKKPSPKQEKQPARDGDAPSPPRAGPATRRLARVLGIDLERVEGSGPGGRIVQEDVVRVHDRSKPGGGGGQALPPLPDFTKFGPVEETPMNKLRKVAARNLTASWQAIPHVTQHGHADITQLDQKRRAYMESAGKSSPKITVTAIAIKAIAVLLKELPRFNSSFDAERGVLILKQYYHIGIAVDTEDGLLVPVLRDVDKKGINEIAAGLNELAGKARDRKLKAEEMQGATFTISNQGGIGGGLFTPIVNHPEVAILGLSRAEQRMVVVDGSPQVRLVLPMSLSYDHRVINGGDAARFIERLSAILSDPSLLLFRT